MKKKYWSDHEKYIAMLTGPHSSVKGARLGYQAYLAFKRVSNSMINWSKGVYCRAVFIIW